ncbi:MAG: alpha/beta hydrolase [Flavobacterium sp.]|nr:alpha/beta hydrolase [Pedobacter sp.]
MRNLLIVTFCFLFVNAIAQTDSLKLKFPVDSNYFSSFDGTRIYYEVRGKGKPVLLVHGFIVNSNSWKRTALYFDLLNNGYQVILLDMRGNGKSGKPHIATAYENDAEAKDITLLMDILKVKHYSAVGYSRGSIITSRLLLLDKRIQKAALGGMGLDFTNPEWPRRILFYKALMGDSIPELKGVVNYVQSQGFDQLALAYLQKSQPSTSKEILGKFKQPIMVICGADDSDNGSAEDLSKVFPNGSFATVPGDHNHASATPEFSIKILDFLKKN